MPRRILCVLLLGSVGVLCAGEIDRPAIFRRIAGEGERTWIAAQSPDQHNPGCSGLFGYALALCEAKLHPERLEPLFALAARMQDLVPQSPSYGSFRWNWADKTVKDANAIEFCMQPGSVLWLKHRDTMPEAAREKLRALLGPAVQASLNHRVADGYTNIALMSAGNLTLLGEGLDRPDVADEGYKRLDAVYALTLKKGVPEYLSPSYYGVDLNAIQLMDTFAQRAGGQRQARALLEYFWTEIAANFWWANAKLGGAHSRDYDYLHGQGGLDSHLAAAGFTGETSEIGLISAIARWQPSAELVAMSKSKLPRLVRRQWGWTARQAVTPTIASAAAGLRSDGTRWASYTHWLARDVTLSISGAIYGPIDVPFTVDFPGARDDVRCYFIGDGRHDPYGKIKIPWRGHPKAVHLQPFFAGVQATQEALALVVYREADVPAGTRTLESHFVMPRKVDVIYIGERKVDFAADAPRSIDVAAGKAVFLRKGTAAVAVRVPAARTRASEPASIALVWDGNEWGAIRLTVDHRQTGESPRVAAAAVFHVRVGSDLNEAAFADFRRRFASNKCDLAFAPDEISVQAQPASPGKPLAINASSPWLKPSRLEPEPSSALLEIDGVDVGRRLLEAAR